MTAICDWGSRGELEVFFGRDIIVDETVSGSVNMRGGYSSYLFVAIYPLSPGDVMDRGSERRPPPEALGSEREESLFRAALGIGERSANTGSCGHLSFAGRFLDQGAARGEWGF
jgi:hypothetical protein